MNIFKLLVFIALSVLCNSCSATKQFEIEISRVESRQLLGGFGSSGKLGEVTEFFVPELFVPLASIPGDHAAAFKKMLYIYKSGEYYACPNDKSDETCFKCHECFESQIVFENLKKFDIKNVDTVRKKVVKSMGIANTSQNGKISVEFIFSMKGAKPLELTVKTEKFGPNVNVLLPFQHSNFRTSIFRSADDPNYYLCPESGFSQSCLVCHDCAEKIEKIKSFELVK